jgi:uncharacterized protein (TIGR02246 family)
VNGRLLSVVAPSLALVAFANSPWSAQHDQWGGKKATAAQDAALLASAHHDVEEANAAWLPGLKQRDASAIVAAYADDGVFVTSDGRSFQGRSGIERMYEERFPKLGQIVGGGVVQEGTAVAGTWIYEWGHAWLETAAQRAGDPPVKSGGSYLTVWQRESPNGRWRIVRNLALPRD